MLTVAVLFVNFGPYHLARLAAFKQQCDRYGWKLVGIELARCDHVYEWQTQIETFPVEICSVLRDRKLNEVSAFSASRQLFSVLARINPQIVAIAGYAEKPMLAALMWSLWHRRLPILLSATKEDDAPRDRKTELIKRWIVQQYKAALVGGKPHKRYLEKLGLPTTRIFTGYNTVGNTDFHPSRIKHLPRLHSSPYFLAINRFVKKKNLSMLIESYSAYRQIAGAEAWDLVLCGDGELRPELEQQIKDHHLTQAVHLPGFLQQAALMPYIAHAECFVHTSLQEQWGLVVNEAMAAGLPVLVSNRCGCFEDLVIEGVNGFGFDPENPQQLTDLMLKLSSGSIDLTALKSAALTHIQQFSPDYFARGLIGAIRCAMTA